jgi:hypothetical protein
MNYLLQPVNSRVLEVAVGIISGVGGLCFCGVAIAIGVTTLNGTETRFEALLVASIIFLIGAPATVYASRLLFRRLRPSHGGIVGPLGLEITGVCCLILPVVLLVTREWGHLLLQLIHVGASTACFALAHVRRRAARDSHMTGPAPIQPE